VLEPRSTTKIGTSILFIITLYCMNLTQLSPSWCSAVMFDYLQFMTDSANRWFSKKLQELGHTDGIAYVCDDDKIRRRSLEMASHFGLAIQRQSKNKGPTWHLLASCSSGIIVSFLFQKRKVQNVDDATDYLKLLVQQLQNMLVFLSRIQFQFFIGVVEQNQCLLHRNSSQKPEQCHGFRKNEEAHQPNLNSGVKRRINDLGH